MIDEILGIEMKKKLRIICEVRFLDEIIINNWLERFWRNFQFQEMEYLATSASIGVVNKRSND